MASLDDRVEKAQDRIVHFFINNEQYINEYITIPLFYESLFHSKSYTNYRCFVLSLLMLRQIFQKVNKKLMVFEVGGDKRIGFFAFGVRQQKTPRSSANGNAADLCFYQRRMTNTTRF